MNRFKELRVSAGKSQVQIAQWLSISQAAYSKYECGKAEPSLEALDILSRKYNVSIDYLLGREGKKLPENQEDKNRLYVPEQYRDVMVAFQDGAENLTQEDIDAVVNFIEYMKSKKK